MGPSPHPMGNRSVCHDVGQRQKRISGESRSAVRNSSKGEKMGRGSQGSDLRGILNEGLRICSREIALSGNWLLMLTKEGSFVVLGE